MPCCIALIALLAPRLAIVLVYLFSDYLGAAYQTWIVPFLGFLFLPLTTLAYAWAINTRGSVQGLALVVVIVAVLIDLGIVGGSAPRRRRKEQRA